MDWKDMINLLLLGLNCWGDLKKREIYLRPTILYGLLGLIIQLYELKARHLGLLTGLIPGLFLLMTGMSSNGKVGYGDGILVLALGIWIGFFRCLMTLTSGLLLAAIWSAFSLVIKRFKKDDQIPFVPFLFFGYLVRLIL